MRIRNLLLLIAAIIIISGNVYADEPISIESLRIHAMGGAYLAVADDEFAIYHNPAGIAHVEDYYLTLLQITPIINIELIDVIRNSVALAKSSIDSGVEEVVEGEESSGFGIDEDQLEFLASVPQLNAGLDVSGPVHINWVGSNFGIAVFDDINVDIIMDQTGFLPEVDKLVLRADAGVYTGVAFEIPLPFFIGKRDFFYVGISAKFFYRGEVEFENSSFIELLGMFDDASIESIINQAKGIKVGPAIGSDLGILWVWPWFTWGFVVQDWFGTRFTWTRYDEEMNELENLPNLTDTMISPSFHTGFAFRFRKIPGIPSLVAKKFTIAVDLRDFTSYDGDHWAEFLTKLHIGIEFTTLGFIKIRAGLNQGYPTVGVGVNLLIFMIDFAFWMEELGIEPGQLMQKRIGVNFSVRI